MEKVCVAPINNVQNQGDFNIFREKFLIKPYFIRFLYMYVHKPDLEFLKFGRKYCTN